MPTRQEIIEALNSKFALSFIRFDGMYGSANAIEIHFQHRYIESVSRYSNELIDDIYMFLLRTFFPDLIRTEVIFNGDNIFFGFRGGLTPLWSDDMTIIQGDKHHA